MRVRLAIALAVLLLAGCARNGAQDPFAFAPPETALAYDVELVGAPSDEIEDLLRQSLASFRRQETGVQSLAFLRRRAADDNDIAQRILRSFGFFEGRLTHVVERVDTGPDAPPRAMLRLTVEPGRPFTLARHDFVIVEDGGRPVDLPGPAAFGSPVGRQAEAEAILDAEIRGVTRLTQQGRPYATRLGRDAVADLELAELEIDTTIAAGPFFLMEAPQVEGLNRVRLDYVLTYPHWEEGQVFDQRRLDAFSRSLADTRLFRAVTVRPPETPPDGETVPIIVAVEEGPRRTVTAGARFSTDRGAALRGSFEHRNMFGANETGTIAALVGETEASLEARYRVPQFLRHEQAFVAAAGLRYREEDAFTETAFTTTAGLERRLSRVWEGGAGGLVEVTATEDNDGTTTFMLFGLPVFARYDTTRDFLNPTQGWRLNVDAVPFIGVSDDDEAILFTSLDARGSHYIPLDRAARYVLAGRVRVATILAGSVDDVPAARRLYSGGGGSVRGFAEQSIGPRDSRGDPSGGLSALEAGVELRARVFGDLGGAVFLEGGSVSEESYFALDEPSVAAGFGVRYFSPVGPIRFDVGFPLNPDRRDDRFQIYLSIGQAF